jgi:hypothetical protein
MRPATSKERGPKALNYIKGEDKGRGEEKGRGEGINERNT